MSRAHPGQSAQYRDKITKRRQRKEDRAVLREAKKLFYLEFGQFVELDRVAIRRIKKKVRKDIAEGLREIPELSDTDK